MEMVDGWKEQMEAVIEEEKTMEVVSRVLTKAMLAATMVREMKGRTVEAGAHPGRHSM